MTIGIEIDDEMTKFMIRNILGHEPCHDFNPAGAGSRYVKLNKQLENVKIGGIYQEGGSGRGSGMKEAAGTATVFSSGAISINDGKDEDDVEINTYEDMKDDSPSTVFNKIAISEDKDLLDPNVNMDSISNIFHSILGTDYNSFLNEFDVDANNMDNILVLNATEVNPGATRRSMTQLRSNTINGIQSTTEMTDYIRMYMFNYIAGYTSSASVGAGAGLKSSEYKGGKAIKPNKSMIEEIEEEKDNALM